MTSLGLAGVGIRSRRGIYRGGLQPSSAALVTELSTPGSIGRRSTDSHRGWYIVLRQATLRWAGRAACRRPARSARSFVALRSVHATAAGTDVACS